MPSRLFTSFCAGIAQLVERQPSKLMGPVRFRLPAFLSLTYWFGTPHRGPAGSNLVLPGFGRFEEFPGSIPGRDGK